MKLYTKIFIGLILGIVVGWILYSFELAYITEYTDYIGKLFINLVKMLVVPLVLVSLVVGAASLGDIRKVGRIGVKILAIFTLTTMIGAAIGISVANIVNPGKGISGEAKEQLLADYKDDVDKKIGGDKAKEYREKDGVKQILELFVGMIPTNPIKALANGDMLAIIFFSLFLGICITMIPQEHALPLIKGFGGLNEAVLKMVTLAMETAPYGVFALMLGVVSKMGLEVISLLAMYAVAVLVGLILHILIVHFSLIAFYLRENPIRFLRAIKEALVFAFSTSSSSATLPVSMDVANKNIGVSKEMTSFVLPLGATINMDGTAIYQSIAAIFIAQVYGMDLTLVQQLTIILTATLASIGAAGVPSAGIVTLAMVLTTIGVPEAGIALIFGLDRILDMCRTVVNVTGDITMSAIMAKSEGEELELRLDEDMIPG